MDSDRELLELAAKAAGMNILCAPNEDGLFRDCTISNPEMNIYAQRRWNPLKDDGDALRLAVKLATDSPGASFEISISKMWNGRGSTHAGFRSKDNPTHNAMDDDIALSTRRAIVRAAAEIGKAMK